MRSRVALLLLSMGAASPVPSVAQLPAGGESAPPSPTVPPAQQRFLQGLKTAGRGVAQIKYGIDRLSRAQGAHDSVQVVLASKRLVGMCSAARGFLVSGRGQMEPTAYEAPTLKPARDLVFQIDSLTQSVKACLATKGTIPSTLSPGLVTRLHAYDTAVAGFRTAIGLPNKPSNN